MSEQNQPRSMLTYFGKRFVIFCLMLALGIVAMIMAMKITNCTVLVGDAMAARAEYVLSDSQESRENLARFFTQSFIGGEFLEQEKNKYQYYNINNYGQTTKVTWVWVWPWSNRATLRVENRVKNIAGELISEGGLEGEEALPEGLSKRPPAWENGIYSVKVRNENGRWLVESVTPIKIEATPTPTPTPTE
ncbi:hypothetical protein LJC20_01655 [Eubacteriales bacterium OttesenSCG-928-M02]|nr:hypothetical protein [Eubacteriales bacterium OttesenSCG-928-M02]